MREAWRSTRSSRAARVVDGSGLADADGRRRHQGRRHHRHRPALAAPSATIDADGLVVMPGIVDAHTHYDPQLTLRAVRHVVVLPRRHLGGRRQLRLLDRARAAEQDHDWLTALFAKVEGMTPSVLERGPAVGLGQLPVLPRSARHAARHQPRRATSATRRCAATSWARPPRSAPPRADEIAQMQRLVREAMRAGAAGFSSSHGADARRPVQAAGAVAPRAASTRCWRWPRPPARAARAASRFLPETAPQGVDATRPRAADRAGARVRPAGRVQGMGYRPGNREHVGRPDELPRRGARRRARRSTRCCARSRSCGRSTGGAARRSSTACSTGATLAELTPPSSAWRRLRDPRAAREAALGHRQPEHRPEQGLDAADAGDDRDLRRPLAVRPGRRRQEPRAARQASAACIPPT